MELYDEIVDGFIPDSDVFITEEDTDKVEYVEREMSFDSERRTHIDGIRHRIVNPDKNEDHGNLTATQEDQHPTYISRFVKIKKNTSFAVICCICILLVIMYISYRLLCLCP